MKLFTILNHFQDFMIEEKYVKEPFTIRNIQPLFYCYCLKYNIPVNWKGFPASFYRVITWLRRNQKLIKVSRATYQLKGE